MPKSCEDIWKIGHTLSGLYSVIGNQMVESVYCDLNKLPGESGKHFFLPFSFKTIFYIKFYYFYGKGFQKWIGYADVKSVPVYFYVQRNSNFATVSTPIPFQLARVNEGNAMDLTSGKFTAPRPGIYFFSFTGQMGFPGGSSPAGLRVALYLNGGLIGAGEDEETNTVDYQNTQVTLQSTLQLNKGDQVWMQITWMSSGAYLKDDHFTGFMLKEEIVASL